MPTGKTFFGAIIAWLGHLFSGLFHVAINTFSQLPQVEQDALTHAVGFVEIIKNALDSTPADVIAQIQAKYPNLPIPEIEASLNSVLHTFNLANTSTSLEDGIALVQNYIKTHTGGALSNVLHSIAVGLAHALSPTETPLSKITALIEAVYQAFHKS